VSGRQGVEIGETHIEVPRKVMCSDHPWKCTQHRGFDVSRMMACDALHSSFSVNPDTDPSNHICGRLCAHTPGVMVNSPCARTPGVELHTLCAHVLSVEPHTFCTHTLFVELHGLCAPTLSVELHGLCAHTLSVEFHGLCAHTLSVEPHKGGKFKALREI